MAEARNRAMIEPHAPLCLIALSVELASYLIVAQALADKLPDSLSKIIIMIAHLGDKRLLERKKLKGLTASLR